MAQSNIYLCKGLGQLSETETETCFSAHLSGVTWGKTTLKMTLLLSFLSLGEIRIRLVRNHSYCWY